jgi:hypothetical protein
MESLVYIIAKFSSTIFATFSRVEKGAFWKYTLTEHTKPTGGPHAHRVPPFGQPCYK